MVELQIISKVLSTGDMSIITDNNLSPDYFTEYEGEFTFIWEHYLKYKNVPDTETFVSNFSDIQLLDVSETDRYLVDTLREEHLYSKAVPVIKKAAQLLKGDANEFSRYLQTELVNLQPNYNIPYSDIIHDRERFEVFKDKSLNKDKWFIPTGFPELDDIIGGWQCGEEFGVLFARTGNLKSWVLIKMVQHAWLMGKNPGFISPEMSGVKVGYRFDTMFANLSNSALMRGNQDSISIEDYENYMNDLDSKKGHLYVSTPMDFGNNITVSKLRNYIISNKIDMIAIDGITYLSDERGKRGDNKTTALTNISEDLMQLSCELKIPVIVVVQSNRGGVEKDTPDLEDIRDSDGISHNATKVISLKHKDEYLIMCIKKNRDGRGGDKLNYLCNIDTGEFTFVAQVDEDDIPVEKHEPRERKEPENKPKGKVVF